MVKISIKVAHF